MTATKRLFAVILSAIMLLSLVPFAALAEADLWDGSVAAGFASGKGTEADPYVIKTAAQLAYLAETVNEGKTYEGEYIVLGANIDLDGMDWTPIGTGEELVPATADEEGVYADFYGNFDGKGYTVSNIYVDAPETDYVGLFGYAYGATIKNVVIENADLNGYENVGAVVGFAGASVIENCKTVGGGVNGNDDAVGGIAGDISRSEIINCHNSATVNGAVENVGGIVGEASSSLITGCSNSGDIYAIYDVGGIAGDINDSRIENCYNIGAVTGVYDVVGGIVGYALYPYYGMDEEPTDAQTVVVNCYNAGYVCSEYDGYVGGIVGYSIEIDIENCQNVGEVKGEDGVGGIAGIFEDGTINACVNFGNIIAGSASGAIVGVLSNYVSEDDGILAFLGMLNDCYYSDSSDELGVGYYEANSFYQPAEEDIGTVTAVSEAELNDKAIYEGLDFENIWTMGRLFPELITHKDAYRLVSSKPSESEGEEVLDGSVQILGVELQDGEYLANGATEATAETPDVGYAYFKNGKLYLNNFRYSGEGAIYGITYYGIWTEDDVEIVLVGKNVINIDNEGETYAIYHGYNENQEDFTVTYSGDGTLDVDSNGYGIYCEDTLYIESGKYNITAHYTGLFAYYDMVIYDGEFDIESNGDGIVVDYFDLYIYGGEFNIYVKGNGIHACEIAYIENAYVDIYSGSKGIESCCECDTVIINSRVILNSYYGIYATGNACIIDSKVDIYATSGIIAYECVTVNGDKVDVYSEFAAISATSFELLGGELNAVSYDDNGIDVGGAADFFGGESYITAFNNAVECASICFEDGTHTLKGNNLAVNYSEGYSYYEDKVTEEWVYDGEWTEELYITAINAAIPDELPAEDEAGDSDDAETSVIYVGGVAMSDGDYLANGASAVSEKAPVRGGYAYYKDGTLTLNNFDYDGAGYKLYLNSAYYVNTLIFSEDVLVIKLVGENIISATDFVADGITTYGLCTIGGEGSLEIIATDGIYSYGVDAVQLYANVTITAENTGITATELEVFNGKLTIDGGVAAVDVEKTSLYNDFQVVEGDIGGKHVVIEYVEPKQPDEPKDPENNDPTPEPPAESKGLRGDINESGAIDMMDYILLKRAYFGTFELDGDQTLLADVNNSDGVDMMDYILLKRVYFGTFEIAEDIKYVY